MILYQHIEELELILEKSYWEESLVESNHLNYFEQKNLTMKSLIYLQINLTILEEMLLNLSYQELDVVRYFLDEILLELPNLIGALF
jgi:hypothetical protein